MSAFQMVMGRNDKDAAKRDIKSNTMSAQYWEEGSFQHAWLDLYRPWTYNSQSKLHEHNATYLKETTGGEFRVYRASVRLLEGI